MTLGGLTVRGQGGTPARCSGTWHPGQTAPSRLCSGLFTAGGNWGQPWAWAMQAHRVIHFLLLSPAPGATPSAPNCLNSGAESSCTRRVSFKDGYFSDLGNGGKSQASFRRGKEQGPGWGGGGEDGKSHHPHFCFVGAQPWAAHRPLFP